MSYDYEKRRYMFEGLQGQTRPTPFKDIPLSEHPKIAELYRTHSATYVARKMGISKNAVKHVARAQGAPLKRPPKQQ